MKPKRIIALILTVVLMLGITGMTVFAHDGTGIRNENECDYSFNDDYDDICWQCVFHGHDWKFVEAKCGGWEHAGVCLKNISVIVAGNIDIQNRM